jgi:hypothetical protein
MLLLSETWRRALWQNLTVVAKDPAESIIRAMRERQSASQEISQGL